MDRRALAEHTGGAESGRPADQFIPPGLPGFEDAAVYPLGGPDLESALRLAGGRRRRAVLYTCDLPGCTRHAQILKANLSAIGIDLSIRQFLLGEMFDRTGDPSEPFDITYSNWSVDYADPFGYINSQFASDGFRPGLFEDPEFERRMADAAGLTGDARLRAYAKLDRRSGRRRGAGGAVRDRDRQLLPLSENGLPGTAPDIRARPRLPLHPAAQSGQSAGAVSPSPPSGFGPPMAITSIPSGPASNARTTSGATRTVSHCRSSTTSPSSRTRPEPATTT